jgi:hypothetical protein
VAEVADRGSPLRAPGEWADQGNAAEVTRVSSAIVCDEELVAFVGMKVKRIAGRRRMRKRDDSRIMTMHLDVMKGLDRNQPVKFAGC